MVCCVLFDGGGVCLVLIVVLCGGEPTNIAQQVFGFLVYLFAPKFSVSVRYATVRPCYLVTVAGRLKYAC